MGYDNQLIFGKNTLENIVSVEPMDNSLLIFREIDGKVSQEFIPNKYWLITRERVSSKQERLQGYQYFKWLGVFSSLEERNEIRRTLRKKKIDFYDIYNGKESSLVYNGLTYFKGLKPKDISILSFDIETTTLKHTEDSTVLLISNTFRVGDKITKQLFSIDEFESQADMLDNWCSWVREMNPSILCGHNIFGFDIPYLNYVADMNGTSLLLGRDGSPLEIDHYPASFRVDGSNEIDFNVANIFGREIIDTMFLAYKYDIGKKYESYGLKKIISQEGLEATDRQHYDASQIRFKFNDPIEREKIKKYAIDDADDALKLFDLMCPALFYFTQSVSKTFQQMGYSATGSQINNMMVRSYLQSGYSIAKADEPFNFEGAISFGIPGVYKNAFKQDVSSLYPSIMRQYKIHNEYKDPKHFFPQLVEYFAVERLKNKRLAKETGNQYFKDLEQSQKVAANSLYGFLGAPGLNYNYIHGAEKVTKYGREILSKAVLFATGKEINYWIGMVNE